MAKQNRSAAAGRASPLPTALTFHLSPHVREVDREALVADLSAAAPVLPEPRFAGDLLLDALEGAASSAARRASLALAGIRVRDPLVAREYVPVKPNDPSLEWQADSDAPPATRAALAGKLYDGEPMARQALSLIVSDERSTDHVHVWPTRRLIVTYSEEDFRYHARYAVHGYPTLFSLLGLRFAPAPSREAELHRIVLTRQGLPEQVVEQMVSHSFANESFDADSPAHITRALASSTLQACAMAAGQPAFCADETCRLFNPHRRPEFLRTLLSTSMCAKHRALFGGKAAKARAQTLGAPKRP